MEKKVNTAKIGIWYVVCSVITNGLAFISTPIFSRFLSREEYGQFSNFSAWLSIISVLITFNVGATISRAKYDYKEEMDQYLSSLIIFNNIITIIMWGILEIFASFFENMLSMDIVYIRIMLLYIFFEPSFSYLQLKNRMFGKYKFFVAFSLISSFMRVIFSVVLVILMTNRLFARVAGDILTASIFYMFLWMYILNKGRCFKKSHICYALVIAVPLIPHKLAGNLLMHSDKVMITNMCGTEDTAIYSIAYTVGSIVSVLWSAMNLAWTPWLYDKLAENKLDIVKVYSKKYLVIFILGVIAILLMGPEIIFILGGEQYYQARFLMPPVMISGVMQFIYGMYVNIEIFTKRTFQISVGTIGAGIINIVLNFIFIPLLGYSIAAYTTLCGYIILLAFHYIMVHIQKEYANIYDTKCFVGIIAFSFIFGGICLWLYNYSIMRLTILGLYIMIVLIIGWKKRKTILNIIK